MSAFPLTKMFLKNTTKMSLNDRFTAYRQQAQSQDTFRQKIQRQRQATAENRRLAQQMANRPSVIAALRLKKRSMQQRLGRKPGNTNVKARLNLTGLTNTNSLRNRLGNVRGRGNARRGSFRPGTSPLIKARLGTPTSNFGTQFRQPQRFRQNRRGRGNFLQTRDRYTSVLRRNSNKASRGKPFQSGRGRWNQGVSAPPTKQELDNQLDEYMAETKGSLDIKPEY